MSPETEEFAALFNPDGQLSQLSQLEQHWLRLDNLMWRRFKAEEFDEAYELAERLLLIPELPLFLRARAFILLSTIEDSSSVMRAQKAFDMINVDLRKLCADGGSPFPTKQLEMAKLALDEAKASETERMAAKVDQEQRKAAKAAKRARKAAKADQKERGPAEATGSAAESHMEDVASGPSHGEYKQGFVLGEVTDEEEKSFQALGTLGERFGNLGVAKVPTVPTGIGTTAEADAMEIDTAGETAAYGDPAKPVIDVDAMTLDPAEHVIASDTAVPHGGPAMPAADEDAMEIDSADATKAAAAITAGAQARGTGVSAVIRHGLSTPAISRQASDREEGSMILPPTPKSSGSVRRRQRRKFNEFGAVIEEKEE